MGYTHHYTIQDPSKPLRTWEIAQDIQNIILESEIPIGDGSGDRESQPLLEHDKISLNGIGNDAHESLYYPPEFRQSRRSLSPEIHGFAFCKTERKPYDVVVCAAIMAIKHHQGDNVEISSDGDFDYEWMPAYRLYRRATGRELPPDFEEYERWGEVKLEEENRKQEEEKNAGETPPRITRQRKVGQQK